MRSRRSAAALTFMVFLLVPVLAAQTLATNDKTVDLPGVRELRADAEQNPALSDELRAVILELCDDAIRSLEAAADHEAATIASERERSEIPRLVERLRADLDRPERRPDLDLSEDSTVAEAEDRVTRERARLVAHRAALRDQERLSEDRTSSRNEISERLGSLDQELELLNDELRKQTESTAGTELKEAVRVNVLSRQKAGLGEGKMLRARLALLGDRARLNPLETDLAQRRVAFSEELVALLERAAHGFRAEQARRSLRLVREQSRRLSEELPEIAEIAAETEELALTVFGPDGIVMGSEQTVRALAAARRHQAQLNRIAELTRRQFEAYGRRGSVARWWPETPADFPKPGAIAAVIQELDEEIPEVEHQLITYEQRRSRARDVTRELMLELEAVYGDDLNPKSAQRAGDLLASRRELLDVLIRRGEQYSGQLVEYRTVSESFLAQLQEVERFLYAHILWSRSVPRPIIPRPSDMAAAFAWLTSAEHLETVSVKAFELDGTALMAASFLLLLVLLRRPMRRRLDAMSQDLSNPERDSLRLTIEALALTALMAAPLPTALFMGSSILATIGTSTYWYSAATALSFVALVAVLLESIRQILAPSGLAEAHFGWPVAATRPLHRGLLAIEAIGLPLLYVALHLAFAGMRLDSPASLQLHNNSLGRVAFVAALLVFGLSILAMLRPARKTHTSDRDFRVPWPKRLTGYAFPTAFLGAYPIVILITIVPAILAVVGFYVTGVLLAYQILRSLLLIVAAMVAGGLVHRWRIVSKKRMLLDSDGEADEEQRQKDYEAADGQVRQLYRFAFVAVVAMGLFSIWSDALPMLQLVKRVQVLPRIELLEPTDDGVARLTAVGLATSAPPKQAPEPDSDAAPSAPLMPGVQTPQATPDGAEATEANPLTLWNLLEAILAGLVMLMLVKNLPGVIEIMLKRSTTLDRGARFAFSSLARYSIAIVGAIIVFGLLGVTWDKVQWLAAALTFGLGFGLQEIVANFVSGLILLIERPVRVGDVVTIGNLMGTVTRIQIRATTITLWDRSEMIVPNKEFITTKLVNWTLSDSKRRIEIPVRITHGADLEQVKKVLVETANQHPAVLGDPAPHALLLGFGDDAVNIELRFVVDFGQGLSTKDEVQMAIERRFRDEGIEFALPTSKVRLTSGTDTETD